MSELLASALDGLFVGLMIGMAPIIVAVPVLFLRMGLPRYPTTQDYEDYLEGRK